MTESVGDSSMVTSSTPTDIPLSELEVKLLDSVFGEISSALNEYNIIQSQLQELSNKYNELRTNVISAGKTASTMLSLILKEKGIDDSNKYVYDKSTHKVVLVKQ